jgi:hypothetical protein
MDEKWPDHVRHNPVVIAATFGLVGVLLGGLVATVLRLWRMMA